MYLYASVLILKPWRKKTLDGLGINFRMHKKRETEKTEFRSQENTKNLEVDGEIKATKECSKRRRNRREWQRML